MWLIIMINLCAFLQLLNHNYSVLCKIVPKLQFKAVKSKEYFFAMLLKWFLFVVIFSTPLWTQVEVDSQVVVTEDILQ